MKLVLAFDALAYLSCFTFLIGIVLSLPKIFGSGDKGGSDVQDRPNSN